MVWVLPKIEPNNREQLNDIDIWKNQFINNLNSNKIKLDEINNVLINIENTQEKIKQLAKESNININTDPYYAHVIAFNQTILNAIDKYLNSYNSD